MRVSKLMTSPATTCLVDDDLDVVARKMLDHGCGVIPVLDARTQLTGVITDRDVVMACHLHHRPLWELRAGEVMSQVVMTCRPDDRIIDAEELMQRARVRRLPVVDDQGRVLGVLSLNDIAREASREKFQKSKEITATEVTDTLAIVSEPARGVFA